MFCDEVLDQLEAIAAGDVTPDGRIAHHLATCRDCAGALADAQQVEAALAKRVAPPTPAQMTARVLTRVRRQRWRAEQYLDLGFNVTIGAVLAVIAGSVWLLLNRTGLAVVGNGVVSLFSAGVTTIAARVGPSLPLYAGAGALLAGALAVWWWAEHASASNWR
ncbi:MAG: hypothetical protein KGN76_01675 [Acidobacteriota bacterium]|nr:hypothetical protein [Acidobacteriota bacterium]